jgi:hypothetical protein
MLKQGDRVKVLKGDHVGKTGVVLQGYGIYGVGGTYKVELDGESDWSYIDETDLEPSGPLKDGCECGCSVVGSPRHSYYCPLFKKEE